MSDQTIEQRLDEAIEDYKFALTDTANDAFYQEEKIAEAKQALLQLLNEARIDEVTNDSIVSPLIGGSLVFTSVELRRLTKVSKAARIAQINNPQKQETKAAHYSISNGLIKENTPLNNKPWTSGPTNP